MVESGMDPVCQGHDGTQTFKANDLQGVAVLRKCLAAVHCFKASIVNVVVSSRVYHLVESARSLGRARPRFLKRHNLNRRHLRSL